MKLSDSGANQICECNPVATPIAFAVNEYSYSFCRPVAVSTDDCEIYFYLDSNSVKRCEKCKIYPRSTYDGIICGKSAADTANCLYPM